MKAFKAKAIYHNGSFSSLPLFTENGIIVSPDELSGDIISFDDKYILPGFADVHVHLREPGFSYKETIASGTRAAAAGGYTAVCSMPNLKPVPDSAESLGCQLEIIRRDALIDVYPYGAITCGQLGEELSDMEAMSDSVVAFSDDGRGVQSDELMRQAMLKAKALGKLIVAHCEVNDLLKGGYIHKGRYAEANGHKGICSESEWKQIERDLKLAEETGCSYHVCHISCKESVELIRQAKSRGVDVTCETAPHYLILCEDDLQPEGRFKMNPPLRSREDKAALIQAIKDGTIDMIATDHAPHSLEEKSRGLEKSLMGIVGIETAFALMYTYFVETGEITLERLVELLCINPRKRFSLPGVTQVGDRADFTVIDLNEEYEIRSEDFYSMGRATPFEGVRVKGKVVATYLKGEKIF